MPKNEIICLAPRNNAKRQGFIPCKRVIKLIQTSGETSEILLNLREIASNCCALHEKCKKARVRSLTVCVKLRAKGLVGPRAVVLLIRAIVEELTSLLDPAFRSWQIPNVELPRKLETDEF